MSKPFLPDLDAFRHKYDTGFNFNKAVGALFRDCELTAEQRLKRLQERRQKLREDPEYVAQKRAKQRVYDAAKRAREAKRK